MLGPFINSGAIIAGSLLGALLSRHIPERVQQGLPATFALASMAIGITMIIKAHFLPVVVLSLMLGTLIGELLCLEKWVARGASAAQNKLNRLLPIPHGLTQAEFSHQFVALIVLFGASGLGVVGALTEGLTGDYQLLLVKSLMDLLTAMIFAITLGASIALIAVVQFVVQGLLFGLAQTIMPWMDAIAFADFSAVGGIIMLAVGFRIAKIKSFAVVNFLPALLLVPPLSYAWRAFIGG